MADTICDDTMPHRSAILSQVIGVTFVGPKGLPLHGLPGILRVRRWRIREALIWLKINNLLYSDIKISEERLADLPEDGIPEEILLTTRISTDVESLNHEEETYIPDNTDEDEEGKFESSLLAVRSHTAIYLVTGVSFFISNFFFVCLLSISDI